MSSTFFGLNISYSGLTAYQAAVNTTANNVANVETEGYSRQKINQTAANALRTYTTYGMTGAGTLVTGVDQIRDVYYDIKYWNATSKLGEYEKKSEYTKQIENYFNDDGETIRGFNTIYDEFYGALEDVENNPGDVAFRTAFVGKAGALCEYFNSLQEEMSELQSSVNSEIKDTITQINSISEQIATLNRQINIIELKGMKANELRDERALLVDKLSEYVDVQVTEDPIYTTDELDEFGRHIGEPIGTNRYTVVISGNQILVDMYDSRYMEVRARESWDKVNQSDVDGLYDIYWQDTGIEYYPVNTNYSGSLKGLLQMRDGNNEEYFRGKISDYDPATREVTITTDAKDEYLQDLNKLTINGTGTITLGNSDYRYDSFSVKQAADGTYTYTFTLADDERQLTDNTGVKLKTSGVVDLAKDKRKANIGQAIPYQGIPYYQEQMNEWVRIFARSVNEIEYQGQDVYGKSLAYYDSADKSTRKMVTSAKAGSTLFDANGKSVTLDTDYELLSFFAAKSLEDMTFTDAYNQTILSSDGDNYYRLTASNFKVNDRIQADAGRMSTASKDADVNLEMHDIVDKLELLKSKKNFFRGSTSAEFLQCVLSDISLNANSANTFSENYQNIQSSVQNQRLSISGVDNDEEALNLVKFQNAYNLSAKMIQVMTEMYDRLILQTGV